MLTQLLEILVRMQRVKLSVPPTKGRSLSRKTKNDASKALGERTKKQHDTPGDLQVGYKEHEEQPLSEMSHTHRDFFGFVTPPSYGKTPASTNKKWYN
jgi:hypothetical protein